LTVALVVTLVVLVFARDVSRAAHSVPTAVASQNESFAALATDLVTKANALDTAVTAVLVHGGALTRSQLAAQLVVLHHDTQTLAQQGSQVGLPPLTDNASAVLASDLITRARLTDDFLRSVATALQLPYAPTALWIPSRDLPALARATLTWNRLSTALVKEPGHVTLPLLSNFVGELNLTATLQGLVASPSLQPAHAVAIAAVAIDPAPLPATGSVLSMINVASMSLSVSVLNHDVVVQPMALTVTLTPALGTVVTRHATTVVAPRGAFGFGPFTLPLSPGESATLRISLRAPTDTNSVVIDRTYHVQVAPAVSLG
jgi:hypothetical protein